MNTGAGTVRRRVTGTALAVGAIALLAGCSLLGGIVDDASGDSTAVEGGQTDVLTISVGDCLNDAQAGETVTPVPLVDCAEPHDSEAYESILVADGDYPGADAVTAQAESGCRAAFESFAGIAYDVSVLDFRFYYPTEETWARGDREILCLIVETDGDGTLVRATGTLAGAAR